MIKKNQTFFSHNLSNIKLPLIPIKFNEYYRFIIDTGSSVSLIDKEVIDYFKYKIDSSYIGNQKITGIEGKHFNANLIDLSFRFENKEYNQRFCVKELLEAFKIIENENGLQVHGILV